MTKDEMAAKLVTLGATLTGEESAADLKALLKEAAEKTGDDGKGTDELTPKAGRMPAPTGAAFEWAVNKVKLNRSVAYVNSTQPGLKGAEFEAAVKERYVALNGLLAEEKAARKAGARRGRVVNMAADNTNDEDDDDE